MEKHVFRYRCPECHHIVEEKQLFGEGCPICGWTTPLKFRRPAEGIPSPLEAMVDKLPSGTDLNAPGWRELGKKKRRCPSCGNEREEKELEEKGCFICGWSLGSKIEEKRAVKEIIPEPVERGALMDVFDRPGYIEVVMDVPDVVGSDIEAEIDPEGRKLIISAPGKSYRREIGLPCSVAGEPVVFLKHGTLEVRVKKHAD